MTKPAYVILPNGKRLDYEIRSSKRYKNLRLKLTAHHGLLVTAPPELALQRISEIVTGKRDWLLSQLEQFDKIKHFLGEQPVEKPQAFDLPALGESWLVEYKETRSKKVSARTDKPGRVIVYGKINDVKNCLAALRRWLARHAKESLVPQLEALSNKTGLKFSKVGIKNQRTRWGSCSARNIISLNSKLLFLPKELVQYILIHELCHTLEHNHSSRFWTLVRQYEPDMDVLHSRMRDTWKLIPIWAQPIKPGREGL
ncbi:MAG: M48 family peptidase [Candidatus Zixiibacteriota bacterium]|nr:MAG: M48 family peptidase [candidate division Zixibacteria bacterium]